MKSDYGKGSEFKLQLPYIVRETEEKTSHDYSPLANIPKPYTNGTPEIISGVKEPVLIVEDNPDMQRFIASLLQQQYEVHTADHGVDGLRKLESKSFSLVISDIMMPEMDGISFVKQVRKQSRYHTTPVIFLSARADLDDQIKGLRIGVEDYLIKPFNNEELKVRVENLLENRRRMLAAIPEMEEAPSIVETEELTTESDEFLEQVKQAVNQHLSDASYNVSRLAADVFLSERQLARKLKSLTGCTPAEYIKEVKLHYARRLLELKKCSTVAEVAAEVGYQKADHFSQMFKKAFGRTPSSFL